MVFNSFTFAAFFAIVYGLYLLSSRRLRLQNALLLVASYFFYGWWDWRFLSLIMVSTVVDYVCGLALDRRRAGSDDYHYAPAARRRFLIVSLVSNLGILGFFKYFDFFVTGCADLLTAIGLPLEPRLLEVILPVGISFYTFQTLSYTIDVYRGELRAQRSLLNFAVFVAFFPQLVAGPILRAREFLLQVERPRRLDLERIYEGGYLVLWGLVKKVVIADGLAVIVEQAFSPTGGQYYGGAVWVALYAFAFQIYCDFSGYTDMARGCAKMMGFELPLNFRLPYFASNPSEFWRRWHISLSTWIRDYLYIPLGGNRRGPRRTCINLMLTMALCGLWHGAAWTFVLWGVFHGLLLIGHRAYARWQGRFDEPKATEWTWSWRRLLAIIITFHLTCVGWLIFRAESVSHLRELLAVLCQPWPWWIIQGANTITGTKLTSVLIFVLPLLIIQLSQARWRDLNVLLRWPAPARAMAYAVMFYVLMWYGSPSAEPFIYFQF